MIWGYRAFIRVFVVLVRIAIWEAIDGGGGVRGEFESEPLSFWFRVFQCLVFEMGAASSSSFFFNILSGKEGELVWLIVEYMISMGLGFMGC